MADDKLSITWQDLQTRRVDTRLREQDALERNRSYAQMKEEALPAASMPPTSIWNNALFCMSVFGLLGGLLAWSAQLLIAGPLLPVIGSALHYDPTAYTESLKRLDEMHQIELRRDTGQLDAAQAKSMLEEVRDDGMRNSWFTLATNDHLTPAQMKMRREELQASDRFGAFVMNLISYGVCGMMLALCLAVAEPITQRKARAAWINAAVGSAAGVAGGVAAALLIDRVSPLTTSLGAPEWVQNLLQQSASWGILGLFLGAGSGIVLRNLQRLSVGIIGGLLGGLIGGALFNPLQSLAHDPRVSQLVALIAIGVVAGLGTGLLENVVKAGWLKVTSGIIAGKQFILYRNPTYIGSSPDCQIYLFKDNQVGKRHAALHLLPTGIEIEDLPLGTETRINGTPVKRAKLKNGDTIQIGSTSFRFQEKRPSSGK